MSKRFVNAIQRDAPIKISGEHVCRSSVNVNTEEIAVLYLSLFFIITATEIIPIIKRTAIAEYLKAPLVFIKISESVLFKRCKSIAGRMLFVERVIKPNIIPATRG